ncbi:chemotaxis protein CheA [Faecalicatena contorta]|uniref:chemotaxis protein CheA n=1 Tax=Faecalicatena contorta TaxID=39482 RepID=UPI00129E4B4D|nr:chemotaxis protein CheA [Faecalicatena contorta]MRM89214.1 chemotaxis protein CheA [Faecalicatena contorta]
MGFFDADAEEMLEVYLLEAEQLTGQLSAVLLETERKNAFAKEDIHSIFRVMHTIKSSSAMMGLKQLSSLAHKVEDLFSYYREQQGEIKEVPSDLFDLLFAVLDYMEDELKRMDQPDYAPADTKVLEGNADAYLSRISHGQSAEPEEAKEEAPGTEQDVIPAQMAEKNGVIVKVLFEEGCRMENVRAFMLIRQMKGMCSDLETYPPDLERSPESSGIISEQGLFIRFESKSKEEVLEILKRGLFVESCRVIQERLPAPVPEETNQQDREAAENKEVEFLSVRSDRLDHLQNLARELLIHMMSLENQLESSGMDDIREGPAHQLERLISEVERTVMEMRMVPLEKIVPKLRRILRDICRDEDKEVEFVANCGDIEADKSVVDYVSEALVHLIRNAVDHGIESPDERTAAGKDRRGKVIFSVESNVGEVLISIADDGRGLDQEKICGKARERGMLTKPVEEYSRQEILDLILQPGFSTKEEVSEYSGRGVGMDVVKSVLESAGGNIFIESEQGRGSTFTLSVPLTLATMECIRFRVSDYRFSMPARYVYQFLEYGDNKKNIQEIQGCSYILFENRMVPMIDLRKFYRLEGETPDSAVLVYVRGTEKEGCILADRMYEQKRIVVKQLPALFGVDFRRKTGVSGMSIMGNGKVCTALDLEMLFGLYEKGSLWN